MVISCNANGYPELAQNICKLPRYLMVLLYVMVVLQGLFKIRYLPFDGLGSGIFQPETNLKHMAVFVPSSESPNVVYEVAY